MEWWEKDEFWIDFEPILFNEERIKYSAIEVEKIISILNLKEKLTYLHPLAISKI